MSAATAPVEEHGAAASRAPARSSMLASQTFRIIAIRIVGAGLALFAQVFASRYIGTEEFGRFALMFVWLLLLGHVGTAGTSQLLYRLLAVYIETGQRSLAAGLVRIAMLGTLVASGLIAVCGIGLLQIGLLPIATDLYLLAIVTLLGVPLLAFQDFLEAVARGLDRPALGIGPAYLFRHLAIVLGLLALLVMGQAATALTVMALAIAGLIISIAMQYVLLRTHLKAALGDTAPGFRIGEWLRTAVPLASVDLTEVLFLNVDVIILGLLVPPEQVALYFAASRLAQILAYIPYGVSAATAQKYAALDASGRRAELQAMIGKSALLATVLAGSVALVLSLFAGPLLALFGSDFEQARHLVPVLCLGIVLACFFGPGEDVLNMLGRERLCSVAFAIALAINIGAALAMVPLFGPMGAAVATVLGLSARGLLLAFFAYRGLGIILPALGTRLVKAKELQS